nr:MAG TPA: hypothetical protein [Caudoviricetes sp.]
MPYKLHSILLNFDSLHKIKYSNQYYLKHNSINHLV